MPAAADGSKPRRKSKRERHWALRTTLMILACVASGLAAGVVQHYVSAKVSPFGRGETNADAATDPSPSDATVPDDRRRLSRKAVKSW